MKKLVNYILLVITTLLLLSCEKDLYPGAYPYDEITFYYVNCTVGYGQTKKIIHTDIEGWDKEKYPMEFWVDNEEVASISQDGYITGKKNVGTVTVCAKVMSTRGMIEGSVKYRIDDTIRKDELIVLVNLGINTINLNTPISAESLKNQISKIKNITLHIGSIADTTFSKISPYITELDTLAITTYKESLDLSDVKIKHLIIEDGNFEWFGKYPISSDSIENYNTYKTHIEPYVLKELKLNKSLEELTFSALPHFTTLDLREYKSLKKITRKYIKEWNIIPCYIIPPTSIEYIQIHGANVLFYETYNSLHTYHFSCPNQYLVVLSKDKLPNLKHIIYKSKENKVEFMYGGLDISSYSADDFETLSIRWLYRLVVSQSLYETLNNYEDIIVPKIEIK